MQDHRQISGLPVYFSTQCCVVDSRLKEQIQRISTSKLLKVFTSIQNTRMFHWNQSSLCWRCWSSIQPLGTRPPSYSTSHFWSMWTSAGTAQWGVICFSAPMSQAILYLSSLQLSVTLAYSQPATVEDRLLLRLWVQQKLQLPFFLLRSRELEMGGSNTIIK